MKASTRQLIEQMQVNEKTDSEIYRILAKRIKGENGEILRQMAEEEAAHCAGWGRPKAGGWQLRPACHAGQAPAPDRWW